MGWSDYIHGDLAYNVFIIGLSVAGDNIFYLLISYGVAGDSLLFY